MAFKLTYKKTVTQTVERNVPDYYPSDASPLGRAVDYLLKDYEHHGRTVRDKLYDDDATSVESAIGDLDRAYETARGVARALGMTGVDIK